MLTAETITDAQIRELLDHTCANVDAYSHSAAADAIKSAANALGYSQVIIEGFDVRMPYGMEAEYQRRTRARCAEILNTRARKTN